MIVIIRGVKNFGSRSRRYVNRDPVFTCSITRPGLSSVTPKRRTIHGCWWSSSSVISWTRSSKFRRSNAASVFIMATATSNPSQLHMLTCGEFYSKGLSIDEAYQYKEYRQGGSRFVFPSPCLFKKASSQQVLATGFEIRFEKKSYFRAIYISHKFSYTLRSLSVEICSFLFRSLDSHSILQGVII